jgi:PAP2 superfamily
VRRPALTLVLAALGLVVCMARAWAGDEFVFDWRVHTGIFAIGGIAWVATDAVLKDAIAPSECRWCVPSGFDDGVRDTLKWKDTETAQRLSNALGYGVAPLSAFGLEAVAALADRRGRDWPEDALIVAESAAVAGDLDQVGKFLSGRGRPYTRDPQTIIARSSEDNLSFYSGHTSFAFSLAVASGTVASIRHYRLAPLVWAIGLTTAAATGYLRVAADRHYATDVLVGAALGSSIGVALPLSLRPAGFSFEF